MLLGKIKDDLYALEKLLEATIPGHPWRAVSVRGREWTIDELFARWRATYNRRIPSTRVPKDYAVARVIDAIDAGLHRTSNGEVPARILDWMDTRAFDGFPLTSGETTP